MTPPPFDQTDPTAPVSGGPSPDDLGDELPTPLPEDPFPTFLAWFDRAHRGRVQPNPNAMTLATIDADGRVSARVVLCKGIDPAGQYVEFFTNYASRKGAGLAVHPRAALVFHWDVLDRQVRLEGHAVRSPEAASDAYFASRPWESRVGAWASDQSRPLESRAALLDRVAEVMIRFGVDPMAPAGGNPGIPRPPHWGGLRVYVERVELWVGGPGRIHDRAAWTRDFIFEDGRAEATPWRGTRLFP